jgi:hypothetical protein
MTAAKCFERYSVITILFLLVSLGFFFVIKSPGFLQQNLEKYFFLLCLPIVALFFIILRMEYSDNFAPVAVKFTGILLLVGVVAWLYLQSNLSFVFSAALGWISIVAILLVALALLYGFLVAEMRRWRGWYGFFAQVLFFLPCLAHDAWQALMAEFNLTSVSVYVALVLELALVLFYLTLPKITQTVMGADQAVVLLNNPVRLTSFQELANSPTFLNPVNNAFRQNYALSLWIYVTPHGQPVDGYHKETQLFSYGYTSQQKQGLQLVKPMIRYYGGGRNAETAEERNKFVFYVSQFPPEDKAGLSHDASLPTQRWNYIVFNYSHNDVNLFINAELVRTFSLVTAMPDLNALDTITVGDPQGGIQGGICNVVYYKHTLTPQQIAFSYNVMKDKDPPLMTVSSSPAV